MPMPRYPVLCYGRSCRAPARFKIAAGWSDGVTSELKTYALSCEKCLKTLFAAALDRRMACRLAPGELLDRPRVYLRSEEHRAETSNDLAEIEATLGEAVLSPYQPITRP